MGTSTRKIENKLDVPGPGAYNSNTELVIFYNSHLIKILKIRRKMHQNIH